MNRTSSSCLSQESQIQRAGSSEHWMSTVFEIFDHDICSGIPLSFRFVIVRSIHIFFSWTEKRPMSQRNSFCESLHRFRIWKAFVETSFLSPIDVVEHRHADDSILKFILDLFDKLTFCPESLWESPLFYDMGKDSTRTQLVLHRLQIIGTVRVARLTLQTRKLWLVDVATDRNASVTLLRFSCSFPVFFACVYFHFSFLFFASTKNQKKNRKKNKIEKFKKERKKNSRGGHPETAQKTCFLRNVTRNREATEAKMCYFFFFKKKRLLRSHSALQASCLCSVSVGLLEILKLIFPLFLGFWMSMHPSQTKNWVWVDVYLCFRPLEGFVIWRSRSHPGSTMPFNRGNIQNLVILVQDQLLRDVEEQRLDRTKLVLQ